MKRVHINRLLIRLLYGLLAGVMVWIMGLWLHPASVIVAHSVLARSDPAANSVLQQAPSRVVLWFTEAIDSKFSEIKVVDIQNRRWDNGDYSAYQADPTALAVSLQKLPNGIYTVAWHNTSAVDGHSLSGSFIFSVGVPLAGVPAESVQAQPLLQSPWEPFVHWIGLLSMLVIVGSLVFQVFITKPVLRAGTTARSFQLMALRLNSRLFLLIIIAAGAFVCVSTFEFFVKTSLASGMPWDMMGIKEFVNFASTYWGCVWIARMAILIPGVFAVIKLYVLDYDRELSDKATLRWQSILLFWSSGLLVTFSLVSHDAAATQVRVPAFFTDYLHLLAASVWIGGIIYLAVVMPPMMKLYRQETKDPGSGTFCPSSHVSALGKFSFLALISAGVLLITGLYSSWVQVTILPALITPYGINLLVKIGLILILITLGALNLFWVRPGLANDRKALTVLKKATIAQAGVAVVILFSAGMLVSLTPARMAEARIEMSQPAITVKASVDWANITMQIDPGEVGTNKVTILLNDHNGKAVNDASSVGLLTKYLNTDLGTYWQYATPAGQGAYIVQNNLSVSGPWQVDVSVQRPNSFDINTSLQFDVLTPGAKTVKVIAPSSKTGLILWGIEAVLIGLLFIPARWLTNYFSKPREKNKA